MQVIRSWQNFILLNVKYTLVPICYVTVLNRFKSCFSFGAILLSIMDFIVIFLTKDAYSLKLHDIGNDTIE